MKLKITSDEKASAFAFLFQNLRLFTEGVDFVIGPDGIFIQSMDSANVMLFEIKIKKDWFCEYDVSEQVNLGINTSILSKILGVREKKHIITIEFDNSRNDNLDISFTSEDKNIYNKEFTIPLVDIEHSLLQVTQQDSHAQFSMPSANLNSIIQQLKLFGDSLNIICNENYIKLGSKSVDMGKMDVNIDINDLHEFEIVENLELKFQFTLNYLSNICQFSKVAKDVEIQLTDSFPMKIVYYLDNENSNSNSISFYLAPQINDDDDI
jgi:proliferating cell nuclear antigen PCNA